MEIWRLDHLALATGDLDGQTARLSALLGAAPGGGGAHPSFGTRNRLWSLGQSYLELIAIDPEAAPPGRPRWFGLDAPQPEGAWLAGWVLRVPDLAAALAAHPLPFGRIERHARGDLHWHLTVPEGGLAAAGGTLPLLIRWPDGIAPPPDRLPDTGLGLASLVVTSPQAADIRSLPLPGGITLREGAAEMVAKVTKADGSTVTFRSAPAA